MIEQAAFEGETRRDNLRLWVVSEVYFPEETSTGYYMTAIAEGLSSKFDVKVLCGQPNYSARGVRAPKHEHHNGTEIFRASGTTLNKNVLILRLVNMATHGLSMFGQALFRFRRADRVLVVTTPPSMPFVIALASLLKGSIFTLLVHDCYPEQAIATGVLRKDSWVARLNEFFNRWLYKHAARIIVVGRDMKELIERKTTGLGIPVEVIPNWAETEDVYPTSRENNPLLKTLGISDKLVVLHAGNIGRPSDVETVIQCLAELKDDERFHFVFIGSGAKKQKLEDAIQQHGLNNLTLLPPEPRANQIEFLNACDIGLVSLVNGMWGAAMPSKTYNIMAAGKPILALTDPGSELAQVIEEEGIGWFLPPGEPAVLLETLETIYQNREKLNEMGQRARRAAEVKYSLTMALNNYEHVIK
jgi:glycosyltransferase involved in cell wall biosynthesis